MAKLTKIEEALIDNVINKVQLSLEQSGQNLFALAHSCGFAYQPFYRLMKKSNLPTLSSLILIANQFECSLAELISNKVFVDIPVCTEFNINHDNYMEYGNQYRVYMDYEEYFPFAKERIFGVVKTNVEGVYLVELFYLVDKFDMDGSFIIEQNNNISKINITSISSKFVIAEFGNEEEKILIEDIKPIAKYIGVSGCFKRNFIFGMQR